MTTPLSLPVSAGEQHLLKPLALALIDGARQVVATTPDVQRQFVGHEALSLCVQAVAVEMIRLDEIDGNDALDCIARLLASIVATEGRTVQAARAIMLSIIAAAVESFDEALEAREWDRDESSDPPTH